MRGAARDWAVGREAPAAYGEPVPVQLTAYCLKGTTRRDNLVREGIVAADPKVFPLGRYVELYIGRRYHGRFLVDDTGRRIRDGILDIWTPECRDARRFGRQRGTAVLVARPRGAHEGHPAHRALAGLECALSQRPRTLLARSLLPCAADLIRTDTMSSFATYLLGFLILIVGLAIAAYLLERPHDVDRGRRHRPVGIGVLMATTRGKMKDPPAPPTRRDEAAQSAAVTRAARATP